MAAQLHTKDIKESSTPPRRTECLAWMASANHSPVSVILLAWPAASRPTPLASIPLSAGLIDCRDEWQLPPPMCSIETLRQHCLTACLSNFGFAPRFPCHEKFYASTGPFAPPSRSTSPPGRRAHAQGRKRDNKSFASLRDEWTTSCCASSAPIRRRIMSSELATAYVSLPASAPFRCLSRAESCASTTNGSLDGDVIDGFADGELDGARSLAPRALVTPPMPERGLDYDAHMCRAPSRKPRHAPRLKSAQYATMGSM